MVRLRNKVVSASFIILIRYLHAKLAVSHFIIKAWIIALALSIMSKNTHIDAFSTYLSITRLRVTKKRAMSSHPSNVSITVMNSYPSAMEKFWGVLPKNCMLLK